MAASDYIHPFLDYLKYQKSYSPNTVEAYSKDLDHFASFIEIHAGNVNLLEVKPNQIRTWVVSLSDQKLKPTSINRKLSTLKSFYRYLVRQQFIQANPATEVRNLKVPQRIPQYARVSEMNQFFDALKDSEIGNLEVAVISLLYGTGIRRAELIGLKTRNVDLSAGHIKVFGKGKKERIVPIGQELVQILSAYHAQNYSSDNFFVLPKSGKPLYDKWVYNCVNKMLTKFSKVSKKSPHILRHSFATHLLQNGAEISAIKELLGHSSLASTQIYAQSDIVHLKKIHKLHPKS
ncbi:MAG: tyrosine-type recombinase/integrase [Flavobacteriales bacterium]|nr:tyrosine-type recombinase/integrase [Flavobacteriales bacterium]